MRKDNFKVKNNIILLIILGILLVIFFSILFFTKDNSRIKDIKKFIPKKFKSNTDKFVSISSFFIFLSVQTSPFSMQRYIFFVRIAIFCL